MKLLFAALFVATFPALASPPNNYPPAFSATVTLSGVTEREHFTWQDTAWRNDPEPLWDLVLIPPDRLTAFVLIDFNGDANVALYLGGDGQFIVDDVANNVRNVSPAFVPEPESEFVWLPIGIAAMAIRRPVRTSHQRA